MNYAKFLHTIEKLEKSAEDPYAVTINDYEYLFESIASLLNSPDELDNLYKFDSGCSKDIKRFAKKFKLIYPFVSRRKYNKAISKCICWVVANILFAVISRYEAAQYDIANRLQSFKLNSGNSNTVKSITSIEKLSDSKDIIIVEPVVSDV